MRFAIIEDNKVVNIAVADAPIADDWIETNTATIGQIYENGEFKDPPKDYDAQWALVRAQRNALLASCDWTQLPDSPVDKTAWATYRQELRDITTQSDPFDIQWPVEP